MGWIVKEVGMFSGAYIIQEEIQYQIISEVDKIRFHVVIFKVNTEINTKQNITVNFMGLYKWSN